MAFALGQTFEFDKKLQLPHNMIYCGATQSGKTTLLMETLQNAKKIYNPIPSKVFFMYNCFQDSYGVMKQKLESQGISCCFAKASAISEKDLDVIADSNGGQTLIIVDDNSISAASSKEMAQLFTMARHKNCSMILLLHFIFGPWPSSRIISANTAYFFLLKSPRIIQQVANLGGQIGIRKALVHAYQEETKKSFGYVLLDLCTTTPEQLRIRSDILSEHQTIYVASL